MPTKILQRGQRGPRGFDPFAEPTDEEIQAEQELDLIQQAVHRREVALRREQATWPSHQQRTDAQLHDQALREVQAAVKQAEKAERALRFKADVSSAFQRNQHLTGPWMAGGAYAASGEIGAVLAEMTSVSTLGGLGIAAAGAAATSAVLWRRIKSLPSRHWTRLRAGIAAGCATCLALPISPLELPWHASLVAAGMGGLVATSARYWRENAPAYPPMGGYPTVEQVATETATAVEDEEEDEDLDEDVAAVIADWNTYVKQKGQILPDAELDFSGHFAHGTQFTVRLVRGKQRFEHLLKALPDIAYALEVPEGELSADRNDNPRLQLEPTLTITTSRPDTTYTGPVVVREGGSVYIEIGPYTDGLGVVRHQLLADQLSDDEIAQGVPPRGSAIGGYVLGDKGSGKSRLMESIALGAMAEGVEVWYLDPQGGASSPVLQAHAHWPLMGLDDASGKRFGNVDDLLNALDGVVTVRQDENSAADATGFQHTRKRPMILVVIDECHQVFGAIDPKSGERFGKQFGEIDRIARKLGIAFLGGSQAPSQDVFGGDTTLRNGMAGANAYLLKYNGSNARLAFGTLDESVAAGAQRLESNLGLGYAINGDRPLAVFQNRYCPDLEPFFGTLPPGGLDELAQIGAGEAYARRHQAVEANRTATQERLEAYRSGKITPGKRKAAREAKDKKNKGKEEMAAGSVSYMFPGTTRLRPHDDGDLEMPPLTERQKRIMEMVAETAMSAKEIAVEYGGVTNRTISNDLRFLREHKLVRLADEAESRYIATVQL